tara:strand:+ start:727 stop:960 length:234 start_codon:yes stop_codon:yes gene_type:complete
MRSSRHGISTVSFCFIDVYLWLVNQSYLSTVYSEIKKKSLDRFLSDIKAPNYIFMRLKMNSGIDSMMVIIKHHLRGV